MFQIRQSHGLSKSASLIAQSPEPHKQLIIKIEIEIEKNETAARRRRYEHSIAMLEDVKAKPDAVLAHNAIDAIGQI